MLKFDDVTFAYGKKIVLDHFSFSLENGEILALMGPSGCGKSTVLSLAAGLKKPNSGNILCDAKRVSVAFQEPRLFPWLTVEENLSAVLPDGRGIDDDAKALLDGLGIGQSLGKYPDELSGGMKARVSLARACLFDGDLILLDEPFSALDDALRHDVIALLKARFRASGASVLFVTHQPDDANLLADRVLTMEKVRRDEDH